MKKLFTPFLLFLLNWTPTFSQEISFNAKAISILSDAEISASTFVHGKLSKEKGSKDVYSIIQFPIPADEDELNSTIASNSALNFGKAIAIANKYNYAYIAENYGAINDNQKENNLLIKDLPSGAFISVIDMKDLKNPKLLYKFPSGKNPIAIDISPNNEYLAVCSEETGKELQILELDEAGKPIRIINKPSNFPPGKISDISWHPSGNFIAFIMEETKNVGLIKVTRDGPSGKIIRLNTIGQLLSVGSFPKSGKFTSDGKYFLVHDTAVDLKKSFETSNTQGNIFVIKFNIEGGNDHFLISKAKVGENSTSFAIHPSGNFVIVSNARKTFYPHNHPNFSKKASLSLIRLANDGNLFEIGETEYEGLLPCDIIFDNTGENVAICNFEFLNLGKHFGTIDFWKVHENPIYNLEKQTTKLFVPRGSFKLALIK